MHNNITTMTSSNTAPPAAPPIMLAEPSLSLDDAPTYIGY